MKNASFNIVGINDLFLLVLLCNLSWMSTELNRDVLISFLGIYSAIF